MKWLLVFLISPCMAFAESMRGVVINVIDGDTVILLEKTPERMRTHRIQLEGIDAPERGQNGYESAKEYLEKLVWGEMVTVRYTGMTGMAVFWGKYGMGRCSSTKRW